MDLEFVVVDLDPPFYELENETVRGTSYFCRYVQYAYLLKNNNVTIMLSSYGICLTLESVAY